MPGLPASLTIATVPPPCSNSTISPERLASLNLCALTCRLAKPSRLSSIPVCRVSSAATRSQSRNVRIARSVMSSMLPIGVATRYSVPGSNGAGFTSGRSIGSGIVQAAVASAIASGGIGQPSESEMARSSSASWICR